MWVRVMMKALAALIVPGALLSFACAEDALPPSASIDGRRPGGSVATGQCDSEGMTRDCSVKLSEHEGILSCYHGVQECTGGVWGPCAGSSTTMSSKAFRDSTGARAESEQRFPGTSPAALSEPDAGAPACIDDPCNPYCVGYEEEPASPITPEYTQGFTYEGNPDEWGNGPEAFTQKQDCSGNGGDCRTGYPKNCNGTPTNQNKFDGCLADHHCDDATGKCLRNEPGWTWPTSVCSGIDLAPGPACHNGTNDGFPLCNRGNTAVAQGTTIRSTINNGNWLDLAACPLNPSGTQCDITLSESLDPGECVRVINGVHCSWTGNAVVFANSNQAVAECGMPQASPPTNVTAPGCSNNWSDIKLGSVCQLYSSGGYETKTITETYSASCPAGTQVQWDRLVYEAATPCSTGTCDAVSQSHLSFTVQTASASAPTTFVPTTPVVAAHAPSPVYTHPASCASTGPSPCPIDLYTTLGGGAAVHYPTLKLQVTLEPSSDGQTAPSLSSWGITYSCPPAQ